MSDKVRQEDAAKDQLLTPGKRLEMPALGEELARQPDAHGSFEISAAKTGRALFTPLQVASATTQQVPGLVAFQDAYETYKLPIHDATVAVGRINDLEVGGAPRTPAEIAPAAMKKFKPIDTVSPATTEVVKSTDANAFLTQQGDLQTAYTTFMDQRTKMMATLDKLYAAQEKLRQRKLANEIGEQKEKVEKINQAAETLAKITEVTQETLTFTIGFDEEFLSAEESYTMTAEEGVQTAEHEKKPKLEKAKEVASKIGGALDLKSIFVELMGKKADLDKLEAMIGKLTKEEGQSAANEAKDAIDGAWKDLTDLRLEINDDQRAATRKRGTTRDAAQTFGQAMGGRESTILPAMMAEAYQELDLYGGYAQTTGATAVTHARSVDAWLNDNYSKFTIQRRDPGLADFDFVADFKAIAGSVKDVYASHNFVQAEAPKWKQAATAWKHFLTDVMGKKFDPEEASADKQANERS